MSIKDQKNELLTNETDIMKRWKEYFQNLLEGTEQASKTKKNTKK